jgi:N-acyl homoserine lactone hydrolase
MLKATTLFAIGIGASVLIGLPAMAQAPADVTLTRIDCGTGATPTDVGQRFTDTFAYKDLKLTFTFSCYLIKHGNAYMVWDTGFAPGTNPNAPKVGIVDRLKELNVTPDQVTFVGISHFHADHTGQLDPFKNATLLIGKGDWDQITSPTPMQGANVAGFKSWIDEKRGSSGFRMGTSYDVGQIEQAEGRPRPCETPSCTGSCWASSRRGR